jgi:hypothetical protein
MSEIKTVAVTTLNVTTAYRNVVLEGPGIHAGLYLLSLFGVKEIRDVPRRQLGEFVRLCELGMPSNTLEEFKQ